MSVKRTYASRASRVSGPSFPAGDATPPFSPHKRPLSELPQLDDNVPIAKRPRLLANLVSAPSKKASASLKRHISTSILKAKATSKPVQKSLTQLHFVTATSLTTCAQCGLSYTRGVAEDVALHKSHCTRVQRGLEWGKDEEREAEKAGVLVVESGVHLKSGLRGRVISFRCDVGGKIGSKLAVLLETINLTLSSPAMPPEALRASKAYIFLATSPTSSGMREKIAGCVIAQRIETAFAVASTPSSIPLPSSPNSPSSPSTCTPASLKLITVDTSLMCYPTPLPTPLGIPRLFTATTFRRHGIAERLLSTAARTFVHGWPLDPRAGEVAFSQPTGSGKGVMEHWGKGGVRIFQE